MVDRSYWEIWSDCEGGVCRRVEGKGWIWESLYSLYFDRVGKFV